jgi:large subunit ribosomal protein L15
MGFNSRVGKTVDQICLSELAKMTDEVIDLKALRAAGLITNAIKDVKVILSGELTTAIKLKGLRVTKGARLAIEGLGGSIEE